MGVLTQVPLGPTTALSLLPLPWSLWVSMSVHSLPVHTLRIPKWTESQHRNCCQGDFICRGQLRQEYIKYLTRRAGGRGSVPPCRWVGEKSWSRFEWREAPQGKMGQQSRADSGGEWEGPPWEALVNRCVCLLDCLLQTRHYSEDVWPFFGSQDPPTPSGRVDDQKRYSGHQEHIVEEGPGIVKSRGGW